MAIAMADCRADSVPTDDNYQLQLDAIEAADDLQTTGIVLAGVGAVSEIASIFFRMRAGGKEKRVEELEQCDSKTSQKTTSGGK